MARLRQTIRKTCREYGFQKIVYSGIVGSAVITKRETDIDVVVLLDGTLLETPYLVHVDSTSFLFLDRSWLTYKKHIEHPTGLVPSVLFKAILLSQPVIGKISGIYLPKITASPADWININVKKTRYQHTDKKNYVVALLFERLLHDSPDLSLYNFDNVEMARTLGANDLADKLIKIYSDKAIRP